MSIRGQGQSVETLETLQLLVTSCDHDLGTLKSIGQYTINGSDIFQPFIILPINWASGLRVHFELGLADHMLVESIPWFHGKRRRLDLPISTCPRNDSTGATRRKAPEWNTRSSPKTGANAETVERHGRKEQQKEDVLRKYCHYIVNFKRKHQV